MFRYNSKLLIFKLITKYFKVFLCDLFQRRTKFSLLFAGVKIMPG